MRVKVNVLIRFILKEEKEGQTIIESLKPDNIGIEQTTSIIMRGNEKILEIFVRGIGEIGSFIQTLDDLLRCLSVSYRFIKI